MSTTMMHCVDNKKIVEAQMVTTHKPAKLTHTPNTHAHSFRDRIADEHENMTMMTEFHISRQAIGKHDQTIVSC